MSVIAQRNGTLKRAWRIKQAKHGVLGLTRVVAKDYAKDSRWSTGHIPWIKAHMTHLVSSSYTQTSAATVSALA